MDYTVRITDESPDWAYVLKAPVAYAGWGTEYTPETYAQLVYQRNAGLHLKMTCFESNPKAVYKKYMDPVYEDSCMECFISAGTGLYMNIEINAYGAMLSAVGSGRNDRIPVSRYTDQFSEACAFPVIMEKSEKCWSAEIFISSFDISNIFRISEYVLETGFVMHGNFYKCGDCTDQPHYLMWNPVMTKTPDYHRPEFFGNLILK